MKKMSEISKHELQEMYNINNTMGEIITLLGLNPKSGGGYRTLKKYTKLRDIDLTIFNVNHEKHMQLHFSTLSVKNAKTLDDLRENSKLGNDTVKRLVLQNGLLYYECSECGQCEIHNDKLLTLQLDHIDGDNNNNNISNLRFLCPNCHTQTPTYGKKNRDNTTVSELRKEKNRIKKMEAVENRKQLILNSGVDFTRWGWITQVSKVLNITPQKTGSWIRIYMPDFYDTYDTYYGGATTEIRTRD